MCVILNTMRDGVGARVRRRRAGRLFKFMSLKIDQLIQKGHHRSLPAVALRPAHGRRALRWGSSLSSIRQRQSQSIRAEREARRSLPARVATAVASNPAQSCSIVSNRASNFSCCGRDDGRRARNRTQSRKIAPDGFWVYREGLR